MLTFIGAPLIKANVAIVRLKAIISIILATVDTVITVTYC